MYCSDFIILIISVFAVVFITVMVNVTEGYSDPKIDEIRNILLQIDPEITKKLNIQASNKSFTEDKRDMYLCLRDQYGKYYPDNMLAYVAIHELAHAKSKDIDVHHTGTEFKNNFEHYLRIAEEKGLFDPKKGLVEEYCGVTPDMK